MLVVAGAVLWEARRPLLQVFRSLSVRVTGDCSVRSVHAAQYLIVNGTHSLSCSLFTNKEQMSQILKV